MRLNRLTSGGRMRRIVDGDTLIVSINGKDYRIRLYGIDAPEKGQPYYNEAKEYLESIVDERADLYKMDRQRSYRRTVAIVYSGDNRDESLNTQMLRSGFAHYDPYSGNLNGGEEAEQEARRERRGMWASESHLEKPWHYRARTENQPAYHDPEPDDIDFDDTPTRQATFTYQQEPTPVNHQPEPDEDKPETRNSSGNIAIATASVLVFLAFAAFCNNWP